MQLLFVNSLAAGISLIIGFTVWLKNPQRTQNRLFGLVTILLAFWLTMNTLSSHFVFFLRGSYGFGILLAPITTIWLLNLITDKFEKIKYFFISLPAIILFFLSIFSDLIIKKVYRFFATGFQGEYGKLYLVYVIYGTVLIATIFFLLINSFFRFQGIKKTQLKYVAWGVVSFCLPIILFDFILPFFGIPDFANLDTLGAIFFVIFVSYSIIRYRFFDIKAIVAEILVFAIWLALFLRIFFSSSNTELILNISFFAIIVFIGVFLVSSIFKENKLTLQLQDLTQNLQAKVDSQTQEIRKSYEVEKKARLELEELDKAKDQFILITQHHLRTPLTIMKGYLSAIIFHKDKSKPEMIDYAKKASASTDRLAKVINEFLDISQFQVGKGSIKKEPIKVSKLIQEILKDLSSEIDKKYLKITINIPKDSTMNADPRKMKEALYNLIDNSIKYNKENGQIFIKGEQTHHAIEKDKKIYRITIEDTGIGITPEEMPKLFTQYFQRGEQAEKLYTTGKGIGLAIAKNIIQAHQGRVYAESQGRDKGAKFVVEVGE